MKKLTCKMSDDEIRTKGIPLVLGMLAGTCGKCGAPYYQDTYTGALRPLCACWNIPKKTTSDHT
jgi:hypothetical protein